jgi:ankyrin repeat protein
MTLQYSWGEFYETMKSCDGYSEEERKKFTIFEVLDKAKTLDEIRTLVKPLTEEQINWLNSPCLDGIIFSINHNQNLSKKEYVETYKYYLSKNLIQFDIYDIVEVGFLSYLKVFIDLHGFPKDASSLLYHATVNGRTNIVEFLLEKGTDTNYKNLSILYYACIGRKLDIVKLLLNHGAVYTKIPVCWNIIAHASECPEIVKIILENRKNFLGIEEDIDDALMSTANQNRIDIMKLLFEHGANVHHWNDIALKCAADRGHMEMVRFLVDKGANISADHYNAICTAVQHEHFDIAKFLLDCVKKN